ncbi:MAG: peptide deformylase [Clostridia bacterium]|nr:peptide deformylase [Clostridia bacterium]
MAVRRIRVEDDPILRMKCKEVREFNKGLEMLIDDMFDTMYKANGVGLAAPQIGILKRIVVIDDCDGHKFELINPQIVEAEGEQVSTEGCLSLPGHIGEVKRPLKVTVRAFNKKGEEIEMHAEEQLAVIISHELDHLEGILYKDKATDYRLNDPQGKKR